MPVKANAALLADPSAVFKQRGRHGSRLHPTRQTDRPELARDTERARDLGASFDRVLDQGSDLEP
jgi:hypothetical protein